MIADELEAELELKLKANPDFVTQELKYYKLHESVKDPIYATPGSACFDLHAWINEEKYGNTWAQIYPGQTLLVPTGLIFDIPMWWSLRLHPRSGLAVKNSVNLANCEGVIDSDYVEPVYVALHNFGQTSFEIEDGMRICQAELHLSPRTPLVSISEKPERKTEREGGFGSTGTK
jgi:dUTP pyrophosphatase